MVEGCVIVEEDDPVVVTGGGPILAGGAFIAIVVVDVVFGGGGAVFFGVIVLCAEIVQDSGGIFLCIVEGAFGEIVVVVVLVRGMSLRWCSARGTIVAPCGRISSTLVPSSKYVLELCGIVEESAIVHSGTFVSVSSR